MIRFSCDYAEGCHPRILKALTQTNFEQTAGYGCDPYCDTAREAIRKEAGIPDADIHFLVGGTLANAAVAAAVLRPHQGILCAETAHIHQHETGAIEAGGHKILALPSEDGKITARQVENAINAHYADGNHEHTVQPGMVYISQPTETGTQYTKKELQTLFRTCKEYHIPLYIDGARLAYALAADDTLSLSDVARCCDILCIGGTKCGALFGEAVMICNPAFRADFRYIMKQQGGLLAKGRLLGIQFLTLFTDGLYTEIAQHAVRMADQIRDTLKKSNLPQLYETKSNQIFTVLKNDDIQFLNDRYVFELQGAADETHTAVRICTSWATDSEDVESLINSLKAIAR